MKKIVFRLIAFVFSIFIIATIYLSIFGIETKRFNSQIIGEIKNLNQDLEIDLDKIKIILDPLKFQINAKTIGSKLKLSGRVIEIETIKTQIEIITFIENKFSLKNLDISTKSINVKNLVFFAKSLKKSPELYILDKFLKKGYVIADINLEFDDNGKIKDNFKVNGIFRDTQINFFKKYNFENLNFTFEIENKNYEIKNSEFLFNNIPFSSDKIKIKNIKNQFLIECEIKNNSIKLDQGNINLFIKPLIPKIDIKNINFKSDNKISFRINKKFKIKNLKLKSEFYINELSISNQFELKNFFPKIKDEINFTDYKVNLNYEKKKLSVKSKGKILVQDKHDELSIQLDKIGNDFKFQTSLNNFDNPFLINFLNFKKNDKSLLDINLSGVYNKDKKTKIRSIILSEDKNKIKVDNLKFNKNFKIDSFDKIELNFRDKNDRVNILNISKKKNNYLLEGQSFNADNFIDNLINSDEKNNLFAKDLDFKINIKKVFLDNDYTINNLNGILSLKNNEVYNADLKALFSKNKRFKFTVNSKFDEKITTLFLDEAEPIVKRYKFIKGYKNGSLDFYSSKKGDKSNSTLKIYDFKLKELPALTKLLTLASLQGIADILSGEGITFDEFEMNFDNEGNLVNINEIYAIGPAISILMNGYIEKSKIVSLRGTLVPATTINKAIGSIPVLGKILVGSKTGEGVFGVSFKIKGPPKNLETTVNPIKTLTPRFITRTLEKIKKN